MNDTQREVVRRELIAEFEQGLEEEIDHRLREIPQMANEEAIALAIDYSERIKQELFQLDEMIQVYQRVESMVKDNEQIQKNNLFFSVFQWSHADSLMIRLRRLVDTDKRTGSLWYLCKFISEHATAFDKQWFAGIYAGTAVERHAPGWWSEVATENGAHVCPVKLMKKANDLRQSAKACSNWISQNVAHLDRNATVPPITWGHYYDVLDKTRGLFRKIYLMLTGADCDCRITIALDWEHCLMVPWTKPSTRFNALRRRSEEKG